MLFKGSGVAIVTPFYDDGSIDYPSLKNLIEYHIEHQTDAIIIAGTTGETTTLSSDEHMGIIEFAVNEVDGRIPVIAGTGSNDTQKMLNDSQRAEALGVDGLLLVTPYYNKATQAGIYEHFKFVHDQVSVPIILYTVPSRTNVEIEAETVYELSKLERVVGLKDASGNLGYTLKVRRLCGPNFAIYSGNDDMIVPVLSVGGVGVISVVANILPQKTHDMIKLYLEGDVLGSAQIQIDYQELIENLFVEPSPIPVKFALHKMGLIDNVLRLPLIPLSLEYQATLERLLMEHDLT